MNANRSKNRAKTKMPGNMSGLGMFGISSFDMDDADDDDIDEGDLEAELNALMSGGRSGKKRAEPKQKAAPMDINSITMMASAALKDDISDHDSDLEGLENDDELLAELNELGGGGDDDDDECIEEEPPKPPARRPNTVPLSAPAAPHGTTPKSASPKDIVDLLSERLKNYKEAEVAAKELGEISKAKRFGRAIKTLEGQLKVARLGKPILEDEIPPQVPIPKAKPPPAAEPEQPSEPPTPREDTEAPAPPPRPNRSGTYPPPEIADLLGDVDEDFDPTEHEDPTPAPPIPSRPAPQLPPRPAVRPQTAVHPATAPPTRPPPLAQPQQPMDDHTLLSLRRDQYKAAALKAKQSNNAELALKYVRTSKQFDMVLKALDEGKPIDLSQMPPPPPGADALNVRPSVQPIRKPEPEPIPDYIDMNAEADPELFKAPPAPTTVLEALEQRLTKYQDTFEDATKKESSSKARRIGRIVQLYQDAIKDHKGGKVVNFDELPAPPGFGPIPVAAAPAPPTPKPVPAKAAPQPRPGASTSPSSAPSPPKQQVKRQMSTTLEKQRLFLVERQQLFREAAKEALKNGASKEQAMEYLKMMKGIEPMLEATKGGLPVDLTSIPIPPQLQQDFLIVETEDCGERQMSGDTEELFRTLERELIKQQEMCIRNKDHLFKLGDISSATKFEKLAQNTHMDLNVVKVLWKRGDAPPRFHYEERVFTTVRHNHDVPENEMQVTVVRGLSLPGKPNELDTYVKIDFGFPTDAPQTHRGHTVKDTTTPEYNTVASFEINRKSKQFLRTVKRLQLKIEVWGKRGFLRADGLLGTASVKIIDLEGKCDIHQVFPVIDGRKDTGGKLEVKVRVTEPFTTKQVEEIKERWLVIGS